jgi:hypothetical protein
MKTIKELKTINEAGVAKVAILFEDGSEFIHDVTQREISEIQKGDRRYIEFIIAKYYYRDRNSVVGVWRYLGCNKEICSTPSGYDCGQCKHFEQTGVYYSESSMGCPAEGSWPYPVGVCKKHGFGPSLSAYRGAEGTHCGWEMADWCKLDDRKLTEEEEKRFREIWG